jgi:hypothetical protein
MSSLLDRIRVCEDESLQARVKQALAEEGKKAEPGAVVAALVKASPVVGAGASGSSKELGPAITDAEIITYVKSLP